MFNLMTNCRESATPRAISSLTIVLVGVSSIIFGAQAEAFMPAFEPAILVQSNGGQESTKLRSVLDPPLEGQLIGQQDPDPAPASASEATQNQNPDLEVLTRGPLHEAFAAVHQPNPEPTPLVTRRPPAEIEEIPPEFKQEGNNVQWLPGYWFWEDDQKDFIWISGIWRDIPLGRTWYPGYWAEETGGYRWITGYWANTNRREVEYLPTPPDSIDQGPAYNPPNDNYFYVPGNWTYQTSRYLWKPGYWSAAIPGKIWVPANYVWTPLGCVYNPGHWDYDFADRGVCFAPIHFRQPVFANPSFRYTPNCRINTGVDLLVHMFVRQHRHSYFYGDWYDNHHHHSNGYRPWHDVHSHHRNYDPLLTYYRCSQSRHLNTNVARWVNHQHQYYRNNVDHRPHRTFHDHARRGNSTRVSLGTNYLNVVLNVGDKRSRHRNDHDHDHANHRNDRGVHSKHKYTRVDREKTKLAAKKLRDRELARRKKENEHRRQKIAREKEARKNERVVRSGVGSASSSADARKLARATTKADRDRAKELEKTARKSKQSARNQQMDLARAKREQDRVSKNAANDLKRQQAAAARRAASKNGRSVQPGRSAGKSSTDVRRAARATTKADRDRAKELEKAQRNTAQIARNRKLEQSKAQRDQNRATKRSAVDLRRQLDAQQRALKKRQDDTAANQAKMRRQADQQRRSQESARKAADTQKRIAADRARRQAADQQRKRASDMARKQAAERSAARKRQTAADRQRRDADRRAKQEQQRQQRDARKAKKRKKK